jgi:hypothetical protein
MGGQPQDAEELALVRLVASGHLGEVAEQLSKRGRRDDVAQVAIADVRARSLAADVPEIEAVLERIELVEPPGSRLRVWGHAMLAERMLLDLDVGAFRVAGEALDDLREHPLPARLPLALRYGRARLTRVASLAWLFTPAPGEPALLRTQRDEAVVELLACNLVKEVHFSRGIDAGLAVVVAEEDSIENYTRLLDARAALDDDPASMFPTTLDTFVGLVAFEVGDFEASLEAFERLERVPQGHPRIKAVAAYGRAFFRLVTSGASPQSLASLEQALGEVRRRDPRIAQLWHGQLANTLADMGSGSAERYARLEAELPPVGPIPALGRQILQWRLAALSTALGGEPVAVPVDDALAVLGRLVEAGQRRRAGRQALRLAHDLARAGDLASASRVHAWGRERLPRTRRMTIWERWWARAVDGSPAWERVPFAPVTSVPVAVVATSGATAGGAVVNAAAVGAPESRRVGTESRRPDEPGLEVQVMAPTLSVTADGHLVELSSVQAKLVVALVVAHPVPLHVEQASDLLWPEDGLDATRYRLNSLVYRLRRALGVHAGAVVRRGDLLHVDPERCEADLWRLRRALVKGTPERVEALLSVTGNLCDAQFPYEEQFVDERHRVCGELLGHARASVRAGEVGAAELVPVLTALDLDPGELGNP